MQLSACIEELRHLQQRYGDIEVMIDGESPTGIKVAVFDRGVLSRGKPQRSSSECAIFEGEYLVAEITSGVR